MGKIQDEVWAIYGNKIRIRVCGICVENDAILLVRHKAIVGEGNFWSPPGGGVELGETLENALKREFREETNVSVSVGKLLFINEFLEAPLHAIEMFFTVERVSGELRLGIEPEFTEPLMEDICWKTLQEIKELTATEKHQFWHNINHLNEFL